MRQLHRLKIDTVHYRLRWSLGRFLNQKMFKSKNLFFSEKGYICQNKVTFGKVMVQIFYLNKTIGDEGITVDFRFIKVHTSN